MIGAKETAEECSKLYHSLGSTKREQKHVKYGFMKGVSWCEERMKEENVKFCVWFTNHCMYYDGWNIRIPLGDKYPEVYTIEEIYEIYKKETS